MDSHNTHSSPLTKEELKEEFRKLSNDVANRKYRRHSPASGSSASDGSPKFDRSSSPIMSKGDHRKGSDHQRSKHDGELDKDPGRSRYKGGDSHRNSDQHTSRNSRGYSRHDDYSRHDKYGESEKKHYQASSHSGRESRGVAHSDRTREESDYGRSRDYLRNSDKYSRDRYESSGNRSKENDKDLSPNRAGSDKKNTNSNSEENDRDRHRGDRDSRDTKHDYHHRRDRSRYYEESRGYRNDSSGRENDGNRYRECNKNDPKYVNDQKEKRKKDDGENNRDKNFQSRAPREEKDDMSSGNHESMSKKSKLISAGCSKDADDKQSASTKQAVDVGGENTGRILSNSSEASNDLNAAKVAALKAAELVNKNLVGTGFMSTEQKKKLLWGSKKSTTPEEPVQQWDSAVFEDRERLEKFNKLMGVKGDMKAEHKFNNQDAEKQKELQMDLEKQYTAGLRRRDGRTVGLGL